jgi:hypothetical protein
MPSSAVGTVMRRSPAVVFDALTRIVPASRSTPSQRSAHASLIRTPVPATNSTRSTVALAPAIWAAVAATWAFTTALLANPLTWIVIAIAALVAAIVALWMNWDTVVAFISDVWPVLSAG